MQTSLAKKIFAVGSSVAMVLAAMPLMASAAVHSAGTNVVSNGTVYFINSAGQKQPYTSAGAFLSYGFNSWANVVPASAEDLALPSGSFVPPMDGSLINDHGTVYLMVNGQPSGFTSEPNFLGLGYSYKNVLAGDVSFLSKGANISTTAMSHPVGTLVNQSGTVYLMTVSGKMGIPSLSVFNSWGYSFGKVVPANTYDAAVAMSSGIMNAMVPGQLNPTGSTASVPVSGGVNVSVDSSTPAAGSIAKSAKVTFTRVDFTAGSQAATVTSLVATRIGLSSDSDVSNVYLYDHATNTQLAVGSFNNGRVTFTGSPLFTVNANSTKVLSIRADMASGGTTGDSIGYGIASAADINVGGATVGGSFPVNGNLMTIAAVSNLGAITITSTSNLSATVNPGTTPVNIGYFQLAGSNQPLSVTYLKLTNVGSVAQTDIQNIQLFNGSTQVGSTQQQASDKTVTFDLSSSPLLIPSGNTINLWVRGQVLGGSNRTFQFTIQRTSDISVTDTTYNTGIVPGLGTATGTSPVPSITTNQVTVNAGSATLQVNTASPTGNIAVGATGVTLGKFDFTASGEDVRVSAITVTTTTTTSQSVTNGATDYFKNGKLVDVTGNGSAQVGSTANLSLNTNAAGAVTTAFSIPGYWTIPAGTTRTLAVVADTQAGTATAAQLANLGLNVGLTTVTAQGVNSLSTVTFGTATARTLTVVAGALTALANPALPTGSSTAPNGVTGQAGMHIGSYTLTAGSSEAVNVTQLSIVMASASVTSTIQNLVMKVNGVQVGTTQGVLTNSSTYNFTPSSQIVVPAGGNVSVDLYADAFSGLSATTITTATTLSAVTATGAVDNTAITISSTAGQTAYIAAKGTLTTSLDAQTPTASQLQQEVMGSTQQALAVFNFAAGLQENVNITSIKVTDTDTTGAGGDLQNLTLYVNGAVVTCNGTPASVIAMTGSGTTYTATFNLQSCPLVVTKNTNISVYVKADITAYPGATSADSHTLSIASATDVTAIGAMSGASITPSGTASANAALVYRTALTIAKDATSPSGASSPNATATVGIINVTNVTNSASQQATLFPAIASGNSVSFTFGGTDPIPASGSRIFAVYKSTDTVNPILKVTMTMGTSPSGVWSGTLQINCLSSPTAAFTGTGTNTIGSSPTVTVNTCAADTINSGQTKQYLIQFDTSDATTGKNFTLTIPTQGTNKVWSDNGGTTFISTLMGVMPLTLGTLTY